MTDDQHRELALVLHGAKGMVMISGYESPLYQDLYGDWFRTELQTRADFNAPRKECLWFNPAAEKQRPQAYMVDLQHETQMEAA